MSLYNHFLSKLLFLSSNRSIPKPPRSFGLQMTSHFVNLYFLLCPSLCQKKRDLKKSSLFISPIGISKKKSINIGKLARIEFMRIILSPYESILPAQPLSFISNLSSTNFHSPFLSFKKCIGITRYLKGSEPISQPKRFCIRPQFLLLSQNRKSHDFENLS